jgi:hypothetical protein
MGLVVRPWQASAMWRSGQTQLKDRWPRRQVSPRGGAGLAPAKGRASQPQRHMALGFDPVQGQGSPNAINIIIFIIFEGNNIKNIIICIININISTII